jgi:hypothetical protein
VAGMVIELEMNSVGTSTIVSTYDVVYENVWRVLSKVTTTVVTVAVV